MMLYLLTKGYMVMFSEIQDTRQCQQGTCLLLLWHPCLQQAIIRSRLTLSEALSDSAAVLSCSKYIRLRNLYCEIKRVIILLKYVTVLEKVTD